MNIFARFPLAAGLFVACAIGDTAAAQNGSCTSMDNNGRYVPCISGQPGTSILRTDSVTIKPSSETPLAIDGLYRIDVTCKQTTAFPSRQKGPFINQVETASHAIAITSSGLTTVAFPNTASSTLLLLPIYSVDTSGNTPWFPAGGKVASNCQRTFIASGRDTPQILGMFSRKQTNQPGILTQLFYNLLSFVTPLTPLLDPATAALVKKDSVISQTQSPLNAIISEFDSASSAITPSPLFLGKTTVTTTYTTATINVAHIKSILSVNNINVQLAFQKTFDDMASNMKGAAASLAQTCAAMQTSMSTEKNLADTDIAFALTKALGLAGLTNAQNAIQCLGTTYGPIAAGSSYWAATSFRKVTPEDFATNTAQPDFNQARGYYFGLAQQLTAYHNNHQVPTLKTWANYFGDTVQLRDYIGITDVAFSAINIFGGGPPIAPVHLMEQPEAGGYLVYGCPVSDAAASPTNGKGAGALLVILKAKTDPTTGRITYAPGDAIPMRVWVDAISAGPTRVSILEISPDPAGVANAISAYKSQCGAPLQTAPVAALPGTTKLVGRVHPHRAATQPSARRPLAQPSLVSSE
jgi:hypothetical protein